MGFFRRLMYRIQQFMIGRYGTFDSFSKFLGAVYIFVAVVMVFIHWPFLQLLNTLLLVYILYRMLSKNIAKRQHENQVFLGKYNKALGKIQLWMRICKDKTHKYFTCPQCKSKLRVPKSEKHKTLELRCTKCGNKFIKKV